jgi:hypothetical protein
LTSSRTGEWRTRRHQFVRWQDRRWGGKGKGMTRPREYIHTRMNVHGVMSGLRRNTKGKDAHAHYPRLHFNLPILQQDSGSTSSTHVQHRVGAATGTFFSTTRKRQDK